MKMFSTCSSSIPGGRSLATRTTGNRSKASASNAGKILALSSEVLPAPEGA